MVAESVDAERGQAEREELAWLLRSRGLGRSANLARVLRFICEEHFAGRDGELKEYTIAVEALGRRPDFDPHTDTIVRVTVHSLRKRLVEIYEGEGAHRPLRLMIPPGRYLPSFLPQAGVEAAGEAAVADTGVASVEPAEVERAGRDVRAADLRQDAGCDTTITASAPRRSTGGWLWGAALIVLTLIAGSLLLRRHFAVPGAATSTVSSAAMSPAGPLSEVHAVFGARQASTLDRSGQSWSAGSFCTGGDPVPAPARDVAGTQDPFLFAGGIRGIARCAFPVKPGLYEIHFFFSEPSDLIVATRVAQFSINARPYTSYDVVDEAGGTGRATSTVVTGVAPENDGAIHVDYISEVSPLNAIEIVPAPSGKLLPVRIVASSTAVTDSDGQHWMPDRFYNGGRHGQTSGPASTTTDVFGSDRIGRFSYNIPVVPLAHYRVRLFFKDPWFGPGNGGKGGAGSRVFDVACNGTALLRHFDILAEAHGSPVVKTFDSVQASAVGRLDLEFLPVVNYPIVNAIEVSAID